jgi:hypothetical protein
VNEMLGSSVAADVVQEPFVELNAEFCASIPAPEIRERFAASSTLAFASKDAGKQWARLRTLRSVIA